MRTIKKEGFYYCYSTKMHKYLTQKGFKYITTAYADSSLKQIWLYEFTDDFGSALADYTRMKRARRHGK